MAKRTLRLSELGTLHSELSAAEASKEAEARALERERLRREADGALFRDAMHDVAPLNRTPRREASPVKPAPLALQRQRDERAVLAESLSEDFDATTLLDADERLSWVRTGLGADVVRKLRRGHWVIQDELDLHGARREEARELLTQFVRDSARRGLRCLRVVHGKGFGSVDRQPVLKARVFAWLTQKDEVLALCQARPHDGGSGALLVLLRPGAPGAQRT